MATSASTPNTTRKKVAWIVLLLGVASMILLAGATRSVHPYAFVGQYQGRRYLQAEQETEVAIRSLWPSSPNASVVRCYAFRAPLNKVFAAAERELSRDGWDNSVDKDFFTKNDEYITFLPADPETEPGEACMVVIVRKPNWLQDQLENLKERLGMW